MAGTSLGWLVHLWIMAGLVLLKLLLSTWIIGVRGQTTEAEPCWNRMVHTDDVLVVCRLEVDVSKTRHGIALVPSNKETKRLLVCGWNGQRCPKCYSDYAVQPLGDVTDVLIVGVSADEWQKDGSYKYQLVPPPDRKDPYIACQVIDTKTGPQVNISVTEETTVETTTSTIPDVTQKTTVEAIAPIARTCVSECGDDQDRGNIFDVFNLLVVATVLLAVILASIFVISIFAYFKLMRYTVNNADEKSSSTMEDGYSKESDCTAESSLLSEKACETISDRGQTVDVNLYPPLKTLMSTDEHDCMVQQA